MNKRLFSNALRFSVAVAVVTILTVSVPLSSWAAHNEENLRMSLNPKVQQFLSAVQRTAAPKPAISSKLTGKSLLSTSGSQLGLLASLGGNHRLLGQASLLPRQPNALSRSPLTWDTAVSESKIRLFSLFTAIDLGTEDYPRPPYEPSDPEPEDGATNVPVTGTVLRWTGGDPNPGDEVVYDIYFDTNSSFPSGPLVNEHPETSYALGQLDYSTVYYWRIVAFDGTYHTEGPVWHFTTQSQAGPTNTPTPTRVPTNTPTPVPTTPLDTTAPLSTILDPLDGTLMNGFSYIISGTAQDEEGGSGVAQVEVSIDGGATWTAATGTETWTFTWTITADGIYNIKSRAMDNAGNVEIPGAGISVTIDNTPPTILVAGWWDTYVSYGTGGTITFLALSQDSDIANVQIYYNRIPVSFYLVDDGSQGDWAAGDGIYMFSSPIGPGVTPGTFLLELVATDHAGNHSMMWPYLEFYETDIYAPPATAKHSWVQALRHSIASAARADAFSPQVMVGGFWDTRISTESGGDFLFLAYVLDPQGPSDMQSVELHYLGTPTGVLLLDNGTQGDWSANDQVYSIGTPIGPGYPADSYLFEIVATDIGGHQSMRYPYFEAFN